MKDTSEDDHSIANSLNNIATALERLGNGGASTNKGALENLAMNILTSSEGIAAALDRIADALENKVNEAAQALV